jgi:signal transduction histidine kinase
MALELKSRLAWRIYLVGLVQLVVVALGFAGALYLNHPSRRPGPQERDRALVARLRAHLDDVDALEAELEASRDHALVTVLRPDGTTLVDNAGPEAPPCRAPHGGEPGAHRPRHPPGNHAPPSLLGPPPPPPLCVTTALEFPSGAWGTVVLRPQPPVTPPWLGWPLVLFALAAVGMTTWWLSRSVVRPLRRLALAAEALGEGDLDARAGVAREDEIGDVARSFDAMAERVGALLRAEKELVAAVSHELRTPLARIRVSLDIAAEGDADDQREALAEITEELTELERLVSDLLIAARLDLATDAPRALPALQREPVQAQALLDSTVERFRRLHPDRELVLEAAVDAMLDADVALLRRVFDNLLENAHKYSASAADPITLRAAVDELLTVTIRDEGIGIHPKDQSGAFRPFFRADQSRTRATGGLGLGLALAKRIVDAHDGAIRLDSEPDHGTTVTVELPLAHGG